jgi:hypothetical protein
MGESISGKPRRPNGAAGPESFTSVAPKDHTPEVSHRKRSYATLQASEEDVPSIEARSVAIDLGMISLHSDSRQQSYLGSSSGVLFTKLIGAENVLLSQNQRATSKFASQQDQMTEIKYPVEKYRSLFKQLSNACLDHTIKRLDRYSDFHNRTYRSPGKPEPCSGFTSKRFTSITRFLIPHP